MKFTNPQTEQIFNYLNDKYKKLQLNKNEFALESGQSVSTINLNIAKGINLPNYIKMGTSKNASIRFNIFDVAEYLSQTIKTV